MFGFLKNKLKESLKVIKDAVKTKPKEPKEEKAKAPKKPKAKEVKKGKKTKKAEAKPKKEKPKEEVKEKVGLLSRLTTKRLTEKEFEKIFEPLEFALLEANVAFEVVERIKEVLKEDLVEGRVKRGKEEDVVKSAIKDAFSSVLMEADEKEFNELLKKKPLKVMFVGVNGVGKTTSLAKFCKYLQNKGKTCVISASDTFRAASIEQLEKHAKNLGVKVIKHDYGADAAAVAFDAVKHAEARGIDVVLIDTAGRSHANSNLMDELEKIKRVIKPDITIFVGDALTGNDVINQAKAFNEKIGIDYIILTKSDVDQKGGAIISVSYVTKKPILFLGTGQGYDDLEWFKKDKILKKLLQ